MNLLTVLFTQALFCLKKKKTKKKTKKKRSPTKTDGRLDGHNQFQSLYRAADRLFVLTAASKYPLPPQEMTAGVVLAVMTDQFRRNYCLVLIRFHRTHVLTEHALYGP